MSSVFFSGTHARATRIPSPPARSWSTAEVGGGNGVDKSIKPVENAKGEAIFSYERNPRPFRAASSPSPG